MNSRLHPSHADHQRDKRVVAGEIILDESAPGFSGATAYVQIEDVSAVDGASHVMAEQVLAQVSHPSPTLVEFTIEVGNVDEHASYNVRALIDVDGDGKPSRGDLVTVQSYPVLTYGYPTEVSVQVRRVD